MTLKKIALVAALAALSSASFANTVTFQGKIIAGACGISGDTVDQIVQLGDVPANVFQAAGDRSTPVPFWIELTDCDTTTTKNAKFTFTGTSVASAPALFATTGAATNVGIRLEAGSGTALDNGVEQAAPVLLQPGNNRVQFGARYESTAATVTPGDADAVANFTIRYY
ncbi:fimbrial protein [Variovorax sp. YR216]|uniref:fimbrial protein n=1 Tax=Variovorax sp. YR216 TaxID=1882828 RepID=UPI0008982268|nr:fimbrial protein [Variovorax sp. YR216]SEA03379.1 major type 1 subunit fimbrin (pilin) [Variovorax sp. YR216]